MHGLVCRIRGLRAEAERHQSRMETLVKAWRPDLRELVGVGPIVAASALVVWSHQGRVHSDGAFAMLAGAAPLPASSGMTTRAPFSTGEAIGSSTARCTSSPSSVNDTTRQQGLLRAPTRRGQDRRAEDKTDREIRRCLKRYIARELYRTLESGLDSQ